MIAAPNLFEEFSRRSCFEFRIGIEGEAAAAAARCRSAGDVRLLADLINRLDEVKKTSDLGIDEDFAFHIAIAHASKNDYFVSVLNSLRDSICEGMVLARTTTGLNTAEKLTAINLQHHRVYDAIAEQNEGRARLLMREHLRRCKASTAHWDMFSSQ